MHRSLIFQTCILHEKVYHQFCSDNLAQTERNKHTFYTRVYRVVFRRQVVNEVAGRCIQNSILCNTYHGWFPIRDIERRIVYKTTRCNYGAKIIRKLTSTTVNRATVKHSSHQLYQRYSGTGYLLSGFGKLHNSTRCSSLNARSRI